MIQSNLRQKTFYNFPVSYITSSRFPNNMLIMQLPLDVFHFLVKHALNRQGDRFFYGNYILVCFLHIGQISRASLFSKRFL